MSKPSLIAALALLPLALIACSSDDDGGAAGLGATPSAFSKYCTGTLKVEKELMTPEGPGAWAGTGDLKAPAGTVFVVESEFDRWGGYVFAKDGTPQQIDADFNTGLVKDTDFTSDCAVDPNTADLEFVVLADSTLYETDQLSGTACKIPAGTVLTSYSFSGGWSGPATISSPELKQLCGWEKGYSNDFVYGKLLAVQ